MAVRFIIPVPVQWMSSGLPWALAAVTSATAIVRIYCGGLFDKSVDSVDVTGDKCSSSGWDITFSFLVSQRIGA